MARVAHTTSRVWQRNQIPPFSQPRNLDRNPRRELFGFSLWPSCERMPVLGVIAIDEDKPTAGFLV
jgi:hypothetical protein